MLVELNYSHMTPYRETVESYIYQLQLFIKSSGYVHMYIGVDMYIVDPSNAKCNS